MPRKGKGQVRWPCGVCSEETHDTRSIECENCLTWVHRRCDGIGEEQWVKWTSINAEYICRRCTGVDKFNYDAGLLRLKKAAGEGLDELNKTALREVLLIDKVRKGWDQALPDFDHLRTDNNAKFLMHKHGLIGRPVVSTGDGNCLFNAVSIALLGSEVLSSELRYRCALQMILHPAQVTQAHPKLKEIFIVSPDYKEDTVTCAIPGNYSSSWNIMALTQVIGVRIKTLYPAENGPKDKVVKILNTTFGSSFHEEIQLLWTNAQPKQDGKIWTPNHFVPVFSEDTDDGVREDTDDGVTEDTDDGVTEDTDDGVREDTDDGVTEDTDDGVTEDTDDGVREDTDDGVREDTDDGVREDTDDGVREDTDNGVREDTDDGVREDTDDGVREDTDDGVREDTDNGTICKGQVLPKGKFLDLEDLIKVLQTTAMTETLTEIPRGKKENVFFVVDNEDNMNRRANGKPSQFWDDRGSWGSGSSNKSLFVKKSMKKVVLKEGKYCFDRRQPGHENKRCYIPLKPQPDSGEILILRRYYTKHTDNAQYQKRVSWLESEQAVHCACHEYVGKCPPLKPHRRTTTGNPSSYVRLKPKVLEQIKKDIKEKGPTNIYNSFDMMDGPRNVRQVHNAKQRSLKADQVVAGPAHKANFADQVTGVEGLQRTTPFVKQVVHQPKKVPCVILYNDEQIDDIKRFCCPPYSAESTVFGIDKTFNLSNVHVTVTTFKNLSLKRRTSGAHPLFVGPLLLHGNSDVDTFFLFLHHIAGKLYDATTSPTFGSDQEAALTKAIARAFPNSMRMSCTRHLEDNLKSFLADREGIPRCQRNEIMKKVFGRHGLLQTASDHIDFSDNMHFLAEGMSDETRGYLLKTVLPPLMQNLQALQRPGLHRQDNKWTNNNSESINHVLKQAVSWKSLKLVDLIEKLQGVVKAQYREVQRSFFGSGEYELCDEFWQFNVQPDTWFTKNDTQKQRHYRRFLTTVKDVDVRSTDGTRTVVEPKHRGKKPGQVKRKRAAKTTTNLCKKAKKQ